MNILFAQEHFTGGGSERHIETLSKQLHEWGHSCVFCFGRGYAPETEPPFMRDGFPVYKDFFMPVGFQASFGQITQDIERLLAIIEEHEIDAISFHYGCCISFMIAAQLAQVPFFLTVHGDNALNVAETPIDTALLYQGLNSATTDVFLVSEAARAVVDRLTNKPAVMLRNPVCVDAKRRALSDGKSWAMVSMIREDTFPGMCSFFDWMPDLDIDRVYVYGSAPEGQNIWEEKLVSYVAEKGLSDRVIFKGYVFDWKNELPDECIGVVGAGRVVQEALVSGIPVIQLSISGYPCGLIDRSFYENAKNWNFSGRYLPSLQSAEELNDEISRLRSDAGNYLMVDAALRDFGVEGVANRFIETLSKASFRPYQGFLTYYSRILDIEDDWRAFSFDQGLDVFQSVFGCGSLISPSVLPLNRMASRVLMEIDGAQQRLNGRVDNVQALLADISARVDDSERRVESVSQRLEEIEGSKTYKFSLILYNLLDKVGVTKLARSGRR